MEDQTLGTTKAGLFATLIVEGTIFILSLRHLSSFFINATANIDIMMELLDQIEDTFS